MAVLHSLNAVVHGGDGHIEQGIAEAVFDHRQ
jgi:hypothetical protein